MKDETDLEELKENYVELQKKWELPEFSEMNADFHIEKIDYDVDFLIREIRKFMTDKFSNYLRFIETLLNPANVPMFVFSIVKSVGNDEKKKLTEIYKKLTKLEVDLIILDVKFDEEKEADFVKESFKIWQEIKKDLLDVLEFIKKNWDNKSETNGKQYFG